MKLTIIEARFHRDTEVFGKMDPYIRLTDSYGKSVRTKVKEDAGKHAIFNETLTFLLKDGRTSLVKLQAYDEDMLKDSLIAEGTFPVPGLLGGPA